jgi:hypothetical protein
MHRGFPFPYAEVRSAKMAADHACRLVAACRAAVGRGDMSEEDDDEGDYGPGVYQGTDVTKRLIDLHRAAADLAGCFRHAMTIKDDDKLREYLVDVDLCMSQLLDWFDELTDATGTRTRPPPAA